MKNWWTNTAARFDALTRRERWLIALAILGGILLIGYSLGIDPALRRGRAAERDAATAQAQLAEMQGQIAALSAPGRHPDAAARAELDALRARLDSLAGRLQAVEGALVPPERVASLLEEMIGSGGGLRLLSLKTLPAEAFPPGAPKAKDSGQTDAPGEKAAGLYRHGVEVRIEGAYEDLTAYLERLERSPLKILWGEAALSAERHPRLTLVLTVYSLSMDRTWLIV